MALEKLTENVEVVQTLGTYPNQENGLTGAELQAKFDEGNRILKDYLNEQVVPAHNQLAESVAANQQTTVQEINAIKENAGKLQEDVSALDETVGSLPANIHDNIAKYGLEAAALRVKPAGGENGGEGVDILPGEYTQTEDGEDIAVAEFYGSKADEAVILRNIAQGVEDHDAVNKKQLDETFSQVESAILYTEQTLTSEQQAQARENIGVKQQRVDIIYNADTGMPAGGLSYADAKRFLTNGVEIIARLSLLYNNTAYGATTRTVYRDEDTQVCFDFAGLGVLRVDNEDQWSFTEHKAGSSSEGAVLYTEQTLTEGQKEQARENIGAASEDDVKGSSVIYEEYTPTIETGYIYLKDGKKITGDTVACTEIIPVKSGDKFLITSAYGFAHVLIVEFDNDNNTIGYECESPGVGTPVTDYEYTVPAGVFGIVVNTYWYAKYPISMKKGRYGSIADDVAKNTADIAEHNKNHKQRICSTQDALSGKAETGFTYDYSSTIGLVIELLKKVPFAEDVKSRIEALENSVYPDALKLPAGIATGTYTLKYENADGVMTDHLDICTFVVDSAAQTIAYNGFIAENVAPKTATKIGIYNGENTRVGEIALGLLSATRYYAHLTPKYTFAAVSDTHVGEEGAGEDFADAVAYFDSQDGTDGKENIEFAVICGDCVDDATDVEQLDTYSANAFDAQTPIYVVMGNHESVNMDVSGKDKDISGNYASISSYFDQRNAPESINQELYYSFEKNGDVFIMVGVYGNYNYDRTFSVAELQWLYETLEENRNKRCFLFHHYFPKNGSGDALNCYAKNDGLRGVQGEIFYSLLRHYKNVIYFHGHSHAKFNAQELNRYNTIDKEYGMYSIHIPSLTKPKYPNATQSEYLPDWEAGEGYIVDVYSNGVHLKGRDFEQGKYTPIGSYWLPTTLKTIEAGTYYDETGTIKS